MAAFLPRDTYKIEVLDGGLNTKNTDITCPPTMSPDLFNCDFSDVGSLTPAKGYASYLTSLGTAQVDCLHSCYFAGTEYLIASQSALVSVATAAATAWAQVTGSTGVFTAAVDVCMRTVEDEVYMTNGYATPHRYNGTELFTVGVSAYTGGLTGTVAATAAGGSFLPGTYHYGISGENANGVESTVATFTTAITVATNGAVIFSALPAFFPASANVSTRYLYRTTAGSTTEFYRVTALTATQTAFTDTIVDSSLVTAAETDNGPPPKCAFWWYHRGRMFAAGDPSYPYRVYYSSAGYPEIWPALNFLEIGSGDGQPITSVSVLGNSLVVHKSNAGGTSKSIWLIYMPDSADVTDASNWYITKTPSAYAAAGWKGVTEFENMQAFVDKSGLYAFTGDDIARGPATSQIGQYAADSLSENIEPDFKVLTDTTAKKISAIDYDNKLYINLTYPDAGTRMYTYDYSTASNQRGVGAWSRIIGAAQLVNTMSKFSGTLYAGGRTTGVVYKMMAQYDTNGTSSLMYYFTPEIAGNKQHWDMVKVWRNAYITMSNIAGSETYLKPVAEGTDGKQLTLASGTSRTYTVVKLPLIGAAGQPINSRSIKLYLSTNGQTSWTTATTPWQIHRIDLEYLLRSRRT